MQIDGLGGSDSYTVNFGAAAPTVIIADSGADGSDTLTVNGAAQDDTLLKNAGMIKWRQTGDTEYRQELNFDGMEGVTLNAGAGNDTIIDPNSGNFVILGGPGDDTITVADTTGPIVVDGGEGSDTCIIEAGNLQGSVSVNDTGTTGANTVSIVGTPGPDTFTQEGNEVTANGSRITLGEGVSSLTLDSGGGAGDTLTVVGTPSIPPTVEGFETDTLVDGTAGNDIIRVTPGANSGEVKVHVNGVLIGALLPTGKIIVNGLGGDDDIEVASGVLVPAWLYGGAGCDELRAGGGSDRLFGDLDNDRLFARGGDDRHSTAAAATTNSVPAPVATSSTAATAATNSGAARATTNSSATAATTCCAAAAAAIVSTAALETTNSVPAPAATRCSAATGTTR